jgi:hypothetical protein
MTEITYEQYVQWASSLHDGSGVCITPYTRTQWENMGGMNKLMIARMIARSEQGGQS